MRQRTLKTELIDVAELSSDPKNARLHDERNLKAIANSLERFGQQKPVVIGSDGVVIAGNGTLQAAMRLGWDKITAVRSKLTEADARAYAIADNRTAELAAWDEELLALTLTDLQGLDFDLSELGFEPEDIERIAGMEGAGTVGLTDPDEVPEPPDEPITQPGDMWILRSASGIEHRLLCGDSALAPDVDRLIAVDPAQAPDLPADSDIRVKLPPIHLVNTDPPYNVKVEPRSNNAIAGGLSSFPKGNGIHKGRGNLKHHQSFDVARQGPQKATHKKLRAKDRPLANDFVGDDQFNQMLHAWFGNIARVLLPGHIAYIWGGYANCGNYPPVLNACKLYFSQAIIWDKEHPVLTRKDFMGAHEWCFYCWKEGAAHRFFGPNNATDLWHVKKINPNAMIHLTEKPVELAVRAILYSSKPRENVLDLFGGSGSTLVACEQTERRAFIMEIDPLYCDIIVQRWERFTGRKAERISARSNASVESRGAGREPDVRC